MTPRREQRAPSPDGSRSFFDGRAGSTIDVPLYRRERMEAGVRVRGPGDHRRGRDLDVRHRQLRRAHRRGRVYRDGAEV